MKIFDCAKRFNVASTGRVTVHIYDRVSKSAETLHFSGREFAKAPDKSSFPFCATLETFTLREDGHLIINGSIRQGENAEE